jgi:hypothetical protein
MTETLSFEELHAALDRTKQDYAARAACFTRIADLCQTLEGLQAALQPASPVERALQALLDAIAANPYELLDLQDVTAWRADP